MATEQTYWNDKGKYQKEYDALWLKLVPSQGEADTVHGETLRAVSRLYYDVMNNGAGNVIEWSEGNYDNDYEETTEVNSYFQPLLNLVEAKTTIDVESILISCVKKSGLNWFNGEECAELEKVIDDVMEYVIEKDKEITARYLTSK